MLILQHLSSKYHFMQNTTFELHDTFLRDQMCHIKEGGGTIHD